MFQSLSIALLAALSQGSSFDWAVVIDHANRAGLTTGQLSLALEASSKVRGALSVRDAAIERLESEETTLPDIVAAMAAGRELTDEHTATLKRADQARTRIHAEYQNRVHAAARMVISTLTEEQQYAIGVPDDVKANAAEALNGVRSVSDAEWGRFSRRVADRISQAQEESLENLIRGQNLDRSDRRAQERAMERDLERASLEFVQQLRGGGSRGMAQRFLTLYALGSMDAGEADRLILEHVVRMISAPASVPALESCLKARGSG